MPTGRTAWPTTRSTPSRCSSPTTCTSRWPWRPCETGKHLSIQKPVGFTVAECQRFVEAADGATARGQVVRVFENFLFYPPVARLVEIVRAGEIGDVLSIRQKSLSGDPTCGWEVPARAAEWRFDLERNGGGPLVFDDGLHKFSIFWSHARRGRRGARLDRLHAGRGRRARLAVRGLAALGLRGGGRAGGRQRAGAAGAVALLLAGRPRRGQRHQGRGLGQPRPRQDPGAAGAAGLPRRPHHRLRRLESEWDSSFVLATRDFIEAVREGRSTLLTATQHREVLSTALAAQISAREDRVVRPVEVA